MSNVSIYNLIDRYALQLGCCFVLIHHSSKGNQSGKAVTDVRTGAGSQSRATDTHLIPRPHEEPGAVVVDAAVRSWPPIEPRCLRWEFPVFQLMVNPLARVPKADEKVGMVRQRRALNEDELVRLLDVARRRPLLDTMTVRRGKHKGKVVAVLRDETRQRLELLGRERALIYKTLVLTGLRKGELASLTVAHLDLDSDPAYLTLLAHRPSGE